MKQAKPMRAITFDEVRAALVPSDIDADLKQQIINAGMDVREYDGTDEDRREKLNQVEGVKFKKRGGEDMHNVTDGEVREWLAMCKVLDMQNDESKDSTYIPVSAHTPGNVLLATGEKDAPMIMQVGKARQMLGRKNKRYRGSWGHGYTISEAMKAIKGVENSEYQGVNSKGRYGCVVEDEDGKVSVVVIDFEDAKKANPNRMNGYKGGSYNTVVTVFEQEDVDEAIDYLYNDGYIETDPLDRGIQDATFPSHVSRSADNMITSNNQEYNSEGRENTKRFQKRGGTTNVREYVANLTEADMNTETEKSLLKVYQKALADYQAELEKQPKQAAPAEVTAARNALTKAIGNQSVRPRACPSARGPSVAFPWRRVKTSPRLAHQFE